MLEIPRKIHYVWLGNDSLPASVKDCINSWKKCMPDYSIKCWNEEYLDIDSVPWVKETIQKKKWTLASDYIWLYAFYIEGSICMDADVEVFKSLSKSLVWVGDPKTCTSESYTVHYCEKSWIKQRSLWQKNKLLIKHNLLYKYK